MNSSGLMRVTFGTEDPRRDFVRQQIVRRLPAPGESVDVVQIFNDIAPTVEYREFRSVLDELADEGIISIEPEPEAHVAPPSAQELLDRVTLRRAATERP